VYFATYTHVYKSTDGGDTWQERSDGLELDIGDQYIHDMAINACHPETVYAAVYDFGASGSLFRTPNGGDGWAYIDMPAAHAVEIDPLNCGRMFTAAAWYGPVYRSMNSATTWDTVLTEVADDIAMNPLDPDVVYLVVQHDDRVYRSLDGGDSWTAIDPDSSLNGFLQCIAVNPVNPAVLYAGGLDGIFKSIDGGTTWIPYSDGLPADDEIRAIGVDGEHGEVVIAGTGYHGLFRRVESLAGFGPGVDLSKPATLKVMACPNPFVDRTSIVWQMGSPAHVTLGVYDVSGRLVRQLIRGPVPAGIHEAVWRGCDRTGAQVSPGIYFVTIRGGGYAAEKVLRIR
jgi:hypothetical protein